MSRCRTTTTGCGQSRATRKRCSSCPTGGAWSRLSTGCSPRSNSSGPEKTAVAAGQDSSGNAGVGDDTAADRGHRGAGRAADCGSGSGGVDDLVEQVDELLHPADEVAGRLTGVEQHLVERLATGPPPRRPREAGVGLPEEVDVGVVLGILQ